MVNEKRSGTRNVGGQIGNTGSEIKYYYNLSRQRIGFTQQDGTSTTISNYGVVRNVPVSFPTSARIGDKGKLWTMSIYPDQTKKILSVEQTAMWALKASVDSSSAILEISETSNTPNNPLNFTVVTQYLIDANYRIELINEQFSFGGDPGPIITNFTNQ